MGELHWLRWWWWMKLLKSLSFLYYSNHFPYAFNCLQAEPDCSKMCEACRGRMPLSSPVPLPIGWRTVFVCSRCWRYMYTRAASYSRLVQWLLKKAGSEVKVCDHNHSSEYVKKVKLSKCKSWRHRKINLLSFLLLFNILFTHDIQLIDTNDSGFSELL